MKILLVDPDKCTGCETCVDICSGHRAGSYSEKASRIRIHKNETDAVFIPLVCEQCRELFCVSVCPVEAIQFDKKSSIFTVNESSCTGCGACEKACPYHGIFVSNGVAMKCDLCGGDPVCVSACYPKSLQYIEATADSILEDLKDKTNKLRTIRSDPNE